MDYDDKQSEGTYTGSARLIKGETKVEGDSIVSDNKAGNMDATGNVVTTTVLEPKDNKKERATSTATAKDFAYDDAQSRATSVDAQGILAALKTVYKADALVAELTGKK